jgi:Uma2 family endonuclease
MSTTTSPARSATEGPAPPANASPVKQDEQRIVIRGLNWNLYDQLSDAIGEDQHVRLAYDGRNLEIMRTSYLHEHFNELLGKIAATVSRVLSIPRKQAGETAWKRAELARGIQADECFYFDPVKLAAERAARARGSNEIAAYPNPDLAIEVDLTEPEIDRPAIYAALQVAEVRRFDGKTVVIEQLGPDGRYLPADSSRFLPLSAVDILRWLVTEDSGDELAWERRLEEWAQTLRTS